jgi:hypothetical protein
MHALRHYYLAFSKIDLQADRPDFASNRVLICRSRTCSPDCQAIVFSTADRRVPTGAAVG